MSRVVEAGLRPRLPGALRNQLVRIEAADTAHGNYHPCAVTLRDGSSVVCVCVIEQYQYIRVWGVYPEDDKAKRFISIEDVSSLVESPSRLPASYVQRVYLAGESGMGYHVFTVVFSDGSRQAYIAGGIVDFLDYPEGKMAGDISDVLPHVGKDDRPREAPPYYWCLYSNEETDRLLERGLLNPVLGSRPRLWFKLKRLARRYFLL
jgi:hypothetical protein